MRISDWSSDVCSSDLSHHPASCIWSWRCPRPCMSGSCRREPARATVSLSVEHRLDIASDHPGWRCTEQPHMPKYYPTLQRGSRSEEHTSELQSLMRISYAVFCLKQKKT